MPSSGYKVRWADDAVQDLLDIAVHIARDSPANARRVVERLRKRAEALRRFPERGRKVPELVEISVSEYRELVSAPYRIYYTVDGKIVRVLAIIDSRRDLGDLLLRRLVNAE